MNVTNCGAAGCKEFDLAATPTTGINSVPMSQTGSYSIFIACLVSAALISFLWYRRYSMKEMEEFEYKDWCTVFVSTCVITAGLLGTMAMVYNL